MIVYEKKIALIERVSSMVENFQAQAKVLRKEKKCPEELTKDVAIVVYLADVSAFLPSSVLSTSLHSSMVRSTLRRSAERSMQVWMMSSLLWPPTLLIPRR